MRSAIALLVLAACGHPGGSHDPPDAPVTEDGRAGDSTTVDAAVAIDAPIDAVAVDAKPGHGATATGPCTYIDQPGWLSCPVGMSCQCYYHYDKIFQNQPSSLDTWLTDTTLEITGGQIPSNQTMYGITPVTIPLVPDGNGGKTGTSVYPYQVTVSATGALQIEIYATSGYVPPAFVLYGDADCGNEGKILDCTFAP